MSITRRHFLRNSAAAGAAAAAIAPASAQKRAEPELSLRERVIWHMREIERLIKEEGADAMVVAMGNAGFGSRTLMIHPDSNLDDCGSPDFLAGDCRVKGGEA